MNEKKLKPPKPGQVLAPIPVPNSTDVRCPVCRDLMPRADYVKHFQSLHVEETGHA
jgi:hypothetical protein